MGRAYIAWHTQANVHWYHLHPVEFINDFVLNRQPLTRGKINVDPSLPNRLSIDKDSQFYDPIYKEVGVRLNGVEKDNVYEYCVSEGWARVIANGNKRDRRGKILTFLIKGIVEPYRLTSKAQVSQVIDARKS